MPRRKDPQAGAFDRTIENPELEAALILLDESAEERKNYAKAGRTIRAAVDALEIEDGERIRCGGYVLTGQARAGGGFTVPAWSKVALGSYAPVMEG